METKDIEVTTTVEVTTEAKETISVPNSMYRIYCKSTQTWLKHQLVSAHQIPLWGWFTQAERRIVRRRAKMLPITLISVDACEEVLQLERKVRSDYVIIKLDPQLVEETH